MKWNLNKEVYIQPLAKQQTHVLQIEASAGINIYIFSLWPIVPLPHYLVSTLKEIIYKTVGGVFWRRIFVSPKTYFFRCHWLTFSAAGCIFCWIQEFLINCCNLGRERPSRQPRHPARAPACACLRPLDWRRSLHSLPLNLWSMPLLVACQKSLFCLFIRKTRGANALFSATFSVGFVAQGLAAFPPLQFGCHRQCRLPFVAGKNYNINLNLSICLPESLLLAVRLDFIYFSAWQRFHFAVAVAGSVSVSVCLLMLSN